MVASLLLGVLLHVSGQPSPNNPPTIGTTPFTVECDEATYGQTFATFGNERFSQRNSQAVRRYVVDPSARTVTTTISVEPPEGGPAREEEHTFRNALLTPSGRVVFCERRDGGHCMVAHTITQERRALAFTSGQTILDLARSRMSGWGGLDVNGDDGSRIHIWDFREGACRRL